MKNSDLPTGTKAVLYYGDSVMAHYRIADCEKMFQGKVRNGSRPPSDRVRVTDFTNAGYGVMDCSDLQGDNRTMTVVFQVNVSGICLVFGARGSQTPSAAEVREIVYDALHLDNSFQFDAVNVVAGTNDTKAALQQLFAMQHGLVPEVRYTTVGAVFAELMRMLDEIAQVFECTVTFMGTGMGALDVSRLGDPAEYVLDPNPNLHAPVLNTALNAMHLLVAIKAQEQADEDGYYREEFLTSPRAVCFGVTVPRDCGKLVISGTGHPVQRAYRDQGAMYLNIGNLSLMKQRKWDDFTSPPSFILSPGDGPRWVKDSGGIVYGTPEFSGEEFLNMHPDLLKKFDTNSEEPLLMPQSRIRGPQIDTSLEVKSMQRLFPFGQLISIRSSPTSSFNESEEHGMMIDSLLAEGALILNFTQQRVMFIDHRRVLSLSRLILPTAREHRERIQLVMDAAIRAEAAQLAQMNMLNVANFPALPQPESSEIKMSTTPVTSMSPRASSGNAEEKVAPIDTDGEYRGDEFDESSEEKEM